jgi:hypothetical protein
MTLHSPSRTSSALRSVAPGRSTTTVRSLRPSSCRISRPCGAPSPSNPLPGAVSSPGTGRRLSPMVAPGRPTSARAPVVPPHLVAGVQPRFGPPAPFLTTLAACSSSDPVTCFSHSHPWGSFPGSPLRLSGRVVRRPPFPARSVWCVPRCDPHERRGRAAAQEAPGRCRHEQSPKRPPDLRLHRSRSRRSWSGSGSPTRSRVFSVT